MPIVRNKYGLALSSRNAYLNPKERKEALVLPQSLKLAEVLIKKGIKDAHSIIQQMRKVIQQKKSARIDYIAIVDQNTLEPLKKFSSNCLIALAVWIGKTRLIDNIVINR
jgi:pantoate--beta-alanine ligase